MVIGFEIVSAPAESVNVPAGALIVTPESALASAIAARSVQGAAVVGGWVAQRPLPAASVVSLVELTVYVVNVTAAAGEAARPTAGTAISAANAIEPNRRTNARAVERCIGFPMGNSPVDVRNARPALSRDHGA